MVERFSSLVHQCPENCHRHACRDRILGLCGLDRGNDSHKTLIERLKRVTCRFFRPAVLEFLREFAAGVLIRILLIFFVPSRFFVKLTFA